MTNRRIAFLLVSAALACPATQAAAQDPPAPASKREEPLSDALELLAAGNKLLHDTHIERNDAGCARLAQRSVYFGTRVRS